MAMDVGQTFLHQTEHDQFHFACKTFEIGGNLQGNLEAAAFRGLLSPVEVPR
jgi:hypothetical protein